MSRAEPMEPPTREWHYCLADGYPTPRQRRRYRKKQLAQYGCMPFTGGMGTDQTSKAKQDQTQRRIYARADRLTERRDAEARRG